MGSKKTSKQQGKLLLFVKDGEYFFQKGLKYYDQNQVSKAKQCFERAWKYDPLEPLYACQLASVLSELGEYERSNKLFKEVLEKHDSTLYECYFFMAHNYAHMGLFSEAKRYAEQYLKEETAGDLAEEAQELLEVLSDDFGQLLQDMLYEDDLIQEYERIFQLLESGNIYLAKASLKKMIQKYPDFHQAYNHLALIYLYLGNEKRCFEVIQGALEKSPGSIHLLCSLSIYYRFVGDEKRLEEYRQLLKNIYPMDESGQLKVGITLILLGEYGRGYEWLRKLSHKGYHHYPSFQFWYDVAFQGKSGKEVVIDLVNIPIDRMSYVFSILMDMPLQQEQLYKLILNKDNVPYVFYKIAVYHLLGETDEVKQLAGLLLIEQEGTEETYEALKQFCMKETATPLMKHVAAIMMFHLQPYKDVVIQIGEEVSILHNVFECRHDASMIYDFLHYLNYKWGTLSKEAYRQLLKEGLVFVKKCEQQNLSHSFVGMTAAFDYVWQKDKMSYPITQKEIATKYMISVSTVQKYVHIVRDVLK